MSLRWLMLVIAATPVPLRAEPDVFAALAEIAPVEGVPENALIVDRFYPLGFSPKGLFAYLLEPADEAVGGYLWAVVVLDLVKDRELEHVAWQSDELEQTPDRPALLAKRGPELRAMLKRHGIVPLAGGQVRPLPFDTGGTRYSLTEQKRHVALEDGSETTTHTFRLEASGKGAKSITSLESRTLDGVPYVYEPAAVGVLLSPHEPRAVVIFRQRVRGYEGPPNVSHVKLAGAHLLTGFKP